MLESRPLQSPLRWAGGKRWLAHGIRAVTTVLDVTAYVEPFAGGAGVFFGTNWPNPVLADANSMLIRCYSGLAEDSEAIRLQLSDLSVDRLTFVAVRDSRPTTDIDAAVRFLYLNRTAYSGLYRENAQGHFNVPYAGDRTLAPLLAPGRLESVGAALRSAKIQEASFEVTLGNVPSDALIYCDPPFATRARAGEFSRYVAAGFSFRHQSELAQILRECVAGGCIVVMSNSLDAEVAELYSDATVITVTRRRSFARTSGMALEGVYVLHSDPDVRQRAAAQITNCLPEGVAL